MHRLSMGRSREAARQATTLGGLMMQESGAGDYVEFWTAGDVAKGEFQCSDCSYGVTVARELPRCPMCGGKSWEQADRRGFRRVHHSS